MTIDRLKQGGYRVTHVMRGYYVSKLYLGYSRLEAIARFLKDCKIK